MFLDIGIGILVAIFISATFQVKLTILLLFISIIFSLGPDLDFIFHYFKRGDTKYDYKHRDLIHYPLLYLPIGTFLIFLLFGKIWALTFLFTSFSHFIHDSIGIGWGIKWLYPFSRKNIAFFYLYSKKLKKGLKKTFLIFDDKKLPAIVAEHGDANWVQNVYYNWHRIAIVEFAVFVISLIILILYVK
jgi:membrane-bound metal-dependent hydrolase YbcI (DUF457 family)